MERRLGRFVNVRTNYQHTTSGGGILLTEQQHEGRNVHALGAGGRSTYRQFEATARLSWERGQQMLFSYVRSKALGDLNTFTAYLGDFPTAPLRPNHYTNTRGDIPHRFIAWGIVNLPWNTRLAPIFQPSRRSCEYGRSSVGSFLRPFQTALPRGFRNPVLGSSAISSTLSDLPTSWATGSIAINTNSVSWGSAAKPASRVRSHPGWASGPSANSARP